MSNRPVTFRQSDVTRAAKAAVKAGLLVRALEISTDGKIVVLIGEAGSEPDANEWDKL